MIKEIEDKLFVAGQMDAQGTAAEKWKIGRGGPVLAMSQRLLDEARALLTKLELERDEALAEAFKAGFAWCANGTDKYGEYDGGSIADGFAEWQAKR